MQTTFLKKDTQPEILVYANLIDRLALDALYDEVSLHHKPGLVCPNHQGSHKDMNYQLFLRSIVALKGYFSDQFLNGFYASEFEVIRQRGIEAEAKMRLETQGINTHKGAIFNLGFACAAIGKCIAAHQNLNVMNITQMLQQHWQYALMHQLKRHESNHGQIMRKKYGITGAIEEVASGFHTIKTNAYPFFKAIYAKTNALEQAGIQTLFHLMANVQDTNIVWRGGLASLYVVQDISKQFLQQGGVLQSDWQQQVTEITNYFVKHDLSPGGSADLLGVTLFFYKVEHEFCHII